MVQWHSACLNTSKAVGSNPSIANKTVTKYFPQNRDDLRAPENRTSAFKGPRGRSKL